MAASRLPNCGNCRRWMCTERCIDMHINLLPKLKRPRNHSKQHSGDPKASNRPLFSCHIRRRMCVERCIDKQIICCSQTPKFQIVRGLVPFSCHIHIRRMCSERCIDMQIIFCPSFGALGTIESSIADPKASNSPECCTVFASHPKDVH